MKNKYQFNANLRKWNKLVRKFQHLYKCVTPITEGDQHMVRMKRKMQHIYLRLEKMQYKMGVKLASTTLALMLVSALGKAQSFNSVGFLKGYPATVSVGGSSIPAFADIDGDNDLDLYIGCSDGNICVLKNNGNNNFTHDGYLKADGSEIQLEGHSAPEFMDFDNDGDLDILVGSDDGKVRIYSNDGTGQFSYSGNLKADGIDIYFPGPEDGSDRIHLETADLDNDGDLDLYIGDYSGHITFFNNSGDNTFTKEGFLRADIGEINTGSSAAPEFVDLDKDGDFDLYLGEGHGTVFVFENDGTGSLSLSGKLEADGIEIDGFGSFVDPEFEDLDDDGDMDLYLGNGTGNIVVFSNDGSNIFSRVGYVQAHGADLSVGYTSMPEFADLDSDGDLDLFVGGYGGFVEFFENMGEAKFSSHGNMKADDNDIHVNLESSPAFADTDNDGDLDLYVGEKYGSLRVYTNNGDNTFTDEGYLQAGNSKIDFEYSVYPTFADIDGDGDMDLYLGTEEGLKVYTNDGAANFSAGKNVQAGGVDITSDYGCRPEFADLDKDGDLDLYTGEGYGYINVHKNDGNGNFSAPKRLQADGDDLRTVYGSSPAFMDIDDDGDLDLFSGNAFGLIEVFLNDGTIDINKPNLESEVLAFPNPAQGYVNISAKNGSHVSVFDVSGKLIQEFYNEFSLSNQLTIDLRKYKSGMYYIKVWNNASIKTEKIVIE